VVEWIASVLLSILYKAFPTNIHKGFFSLIRNFPKAIEFLPSLKIFDSIKEQGTGNGEKKWPLMVGEK
jgi:hypothetical protein